MYSHNIMNKVYEWLYVEDFFATIVENIIHSL